MRKKCLLILSKKRRCLIPADSFFEWKHTKISKVPYVIKLKDSHPFAFAGIWDNAPEGAKYKNSFAILTTKAEGKIASIHDRMPVILERNEEKAWLDERLNEKEVIALLDPYPDELIEMYQVSNDVNSPKNDSPEILKTNN